MIERKRYKIPELLAPAGGMAQLRAAVENGADAVYLGGKQFNARMNADNFDEERINEALEYAHLRGVKLYVTMNTLLNDDQIPEALEYAAKLYRSGADAFIVQDLGFAALLKETMPDIQLHLSTQGTVYNAEGVAKAAALGFRRVVLAREVPLQEIKKIVSQNFAEIEVFIHGAMCICYSGQCEMSFEIGGRSGNMGNCAQPCRLPYAFIGEEQKGTSKWTNHSIDKEKKSEEVTYALSPKDLSALPLLWKLINSGVTSLKIEGRMKSPEYVAVVTGIYRKYLDMYAEGMDCAMNGDCSETSVNMPKIAKEDRAALCQIFSRGGFTEGYLPGNPGIELLSGDIPKHQGILIGRTSEGGGKPGKDLISADLTGELSMGDGIEIRNENMPGNVVTYLAIGGKQVKCAHSGDKVVIGDIKGKVGAGDPIYKITDLALMEKARATYEGKSWESEKALKKTIVNARFSALTSEGLSLGLYVDGGVGVTVHSDEYTEASGTINEERVKKQLHKMGGTPFALGKCEVITDGKVSASAAAINSIRRRAVSELTEKMRDKSRRKSVELYMDKALEMRMGGGITAMNHESDIKKEKSLLKSVYIMYEKKLWEILDDSKNSSAMLQDESQIQMRDEKQILYLPFRLFMKHLDGCKSLKGRYQIIPTLGSVTAGPADEWLRKNMNELAEASLAVAEGIVSVGNIGWIEALASSGLRIWGDYGLNLYNSADFYMAKEMGLEAAVVSPELTEEKIARLNFHGIVPEFYHGGRIPVMVTENTLIGWGESPKAQEYRFLRDRKGERFPVLRDFENEKTYIFHCREKTGIRFDRKDGLPDKLIIRTYLGAE